MSPLPFPLLLSSLSSGHGHGCEDEYDGYVWYIYTNRQLNSLSRRRLRYYVKHITNAISSTELCESNDSTWLKVKITWQAIVKTISHFRLLPRERVQFGELIGHYIRYFLSFFFFFRYLHTFWVFRLSVWGSCLWLNLAVWPDWPGYLFWTSERCCGELGSWSVCLCVYVCVYVRTSRSLWVTG